MTKENFEKIPEITANPGRVRLSAKPTKQGLQAIEYEKKFNGTTIVVEEVRTGKGKLTLKTMYKRPN